MDKLAEGEELRLTVRVADGVMSVACQGFSGAWLFHEGCAALLKINDSGTVELERVQADNVDLEARGHFEPLLEG